MKPLIIDCSQLGHASLHTMSNLSYEEKKTGVLYGFLLQIFKLAKGFDTNEFVFCWDSRKSYRKDFFSEYKGDRDKKERTPEEEFDFKHFKVQMGMLRDKILPMMGFKNNFIKTGLEADDLIAYAVKELPGCVVVSNDSDLYQLLGFCEMYHISTKVRFCARDLMNKYKVSPADWVGILAIAGTHNNVPGVLGAGIVKAINYLKNDLPDGVVKDRIKASGELIERNRKLIKLPYVEGGLNINFGERFRMDDWLDVFDRYNFRSFSEPKFLGKLKENFKLC